MELVKYASFAAKVVADLKIRPVDKTGLARLVEYGVEIAGRKKKLTLKMAMIRDVMREADYWAKEANVETIGREEVEKAIRQMIFRSNLYEEKIQEFIMDGYVNIETSGRRGGPDQRLVGVQPGGPHVRPSVPHHGFNFHRPRRRDEHRP